MPLDPFDVWADQTIKVWPENYWLLEVGPGAEALAGQALAVSAGRYACVIRDQTGFSLVVDDPAHEALRGDPAIRQAFGPLKVISTDSPLPFDVVGFIRAALQVVNGAGFKAAPQCGAGADHFFTGAADIEQVKALFERLIADAKDRRAAA